MLKTIQLHNFRSFLNFRADLTALHLVIGRNNSGKTNLARALQFLSWSSANSLSEAAGAIPGGISELRHRQTQRGPIQLACECELEYGGQATRFTYALELDISQDSSGKLELSVISEVLKCLVGSFGEAVLFQSDGREARMLHETEFFQRNRTAYTDPTLVPVGATMLSKLYELRDNPRSTLFKRYLGNWAYFSLSPHQMRFGWQEAKEVFALLQLGNNLVQAMYQLKNQDELRYHRVIERIRVLEPGLRAINFIPSPGQAPVPFIQMDGGAKISWAGLSDGTLRVLGMCAIIEQYAMYIEGQTAGAGLVIIEEPENGIAPAHLRRVYDFFADTPAAQFLFTSHSPYFIDFFDPDRASVSLLQMSSGRTELVTPSVSAGQTDTEERMTLSEQYASELLG